MKVTAVVFADRIEHDGPKLNIYGANLPILGFTLGEETPFSFMVTYRFEDFDLDEEHWIDFEFKSPSGQMLAFSGRTGHGPFPPSPDPTWYPSGAHIGRPIVSFSEGGRHTLEMVHNLERTVIGDILVAPRTEPIS